LSPAILIIIALLIGGTFSGFLYSKAAGCATMVICGLLLLSLAMWVIERVASCDPGRGVC
jgi:hypothetical protein